MERGLGRYWSAVVSSEPRWRSGRALLQVTKEPDEAEEGEGREGRPCGPRLREKYRLPLCRETVIVFNITDSLSDIIKDRPTYLAGLFFLSPPFVPRRCREKETRGWITVLHIVYA